MTIQNYGYNFYNASNSNSLSDESPQSEKNNPPLFKINQDPHTPPPPPLPNLQKREITVKKEQDFDSLIVEEEEFHEIKVKQEPGLELSSSKELLSITTVKKRIKLINPNFDSEKEIGVENCLPCCISFYNWILSGADFPEAVDPYAKPLHEHMFPQKKHPSFLLQDPFLENLHNPKEVKVLDGVGKVKEYICLTEDLPLTFNSVKLRDLKTTIASNSVPWQQYEKGGETFKLGILFLNHRNDESKAHFLAFQYRKTSSNQYTLYIDDPQPGEVCTFAQFLKDFGHLYTPNIKIWTGQNKINYDCNQTVEQMFKTLKTEQEEKIQSSSNKESNEKKGAGAANTTLKISVKRKRNFDEESLETPIKQARSEADQPLVNNSPKSGTENAWARIAMMTRANSLNTIKITDEDFVDESWEKDMQETPSTMVPKSTLNWLENRAKSSEKSQNFISETNRPKDVVANTVPDNITTSKKILESDKRNSTIEDKLNAQKFSFLFENLSEAQENSFLQPELSDAPLNTQKNHLLSEDFEVLKHSADLGNANAQYRIGYMYLKGSEGVSRDQTLAFKYLKLAANQGVAEAQFYIGFIYHEVGIQNDLALSFHYFKLAADQGYAKAQLSLGKLYLNGPGNVFQGFIQAFNYIKLAADQSLPEAQFYLGTMYLEGKGCQINYKEGMKYCELAANKGILAAQLHVAKIHTYKLNYKEAFTFYKLAADQGNEFAHYTLGTIYHTGRGVPKDLVEAQRYYWLAVMQGNALAKEKLEQISRLHFRKTF